MENQFNPNYAKLELHMRQHSNAIEQLKQLGATFWIGPDIELAEKITVPPKMIAMDVPVILSKKQLPDIPITQGALSSLGWSVRSFLAQSGIESSFDPRSLSDELVNKINNGEEVHVPIAILNHGQRAVEMEGKCMRFFWADDSKRLRGNDLKEIVGTELEFGGQENVDWKFGGVDFAEDEKNIREAYKGEIDTVCIKLPLSLVKLYIPPAEEPLRIQGRKELQNVLKEIPEDLDLDFKIGETTTVKLSENIMAVINIGGYPEGRHIRSPLIDPGFEGKIRTEIEGPLDYIELFIYKK